MLDGERCGLDACAEVDADAGESGEEGGLLRSEESMSSRRFVNSPTRGSSTALVGLSTSSSQDPPREEEPVLVYADHPPLEGGLPMPRIALPFPFLEPEPDPDPDPDDEPAMVPVPAIEPSSISTPSLSNAVPVPVPVLLLVPAVNPDRMLCADCAELRPL